MIHVPDSGFFHAAHILQPHGNTLRILTSPKGVQRRDLLQVQMNQVSLNCRGGDTGRKTTTGKAMVANKPALLQRGSMMPGDWRKRSWKSVFITSCIWQNPYFTSFQPLNLV